MLKAFMIAFTIKVSLALAWATYEISRAVWRYRLAGPWHRRRAAARQREYLQDLDRHGISRVPNRQEGSLPSMVKPETDR